MAVQRGEREEEDGKMNAEICCGGTEERRRDERG
jgi:hypothetical protein